MQPLPLKKVAPSFPATPLSKLRSCQAPRFWKFDRMFNRPSIKGGGGVYTTCIEHLRWLPLKSRSFSSLVLHREVALKIFAISRKIKVMKSGCVNLPNLHSVVDVFSEFFKRFWNIGMLSCFSRYSDTRPL